MKLKSLKRKNNKTNNPYKRVNQMFAQGKKVKETQQNFSFLQLIKALLNFRKGNSYAKKG